MRESFAALTRFLEQVSQVYENFRDENLWWRGQPEPGLKLIPRVYRGYSPWDEFQLVGNFDRQAPLRYSHWPSEPSHRLFLMQHFGLPTRLLDWSMGVLTALYFAVNEDKEGKPASVWALHPIKLNRRQTADPHACVFHHDHPKVRALVDLAFVQCTERANVGNLVLATSGPELDLRLLVQWATFTIHASASPLEELPEHGDFLVEVPIAPEDRLPLRHALVIAGFSRERLFPDLQSLAEHLRNKVGRPADV
jgi:FRG domain